VPPTYLQHRQRTDSGFVKNVENGLKLEIRIVIKLSKMSYVNDTLITLIRAGELRAGSYVSCTLPRNGGVCRGVLRPNGKITFGIGGRTVPFSLNEFVKTVFGYGPNAWLCVRDEHDVTLHEVRARYERETGHQLTRKQNGNARRSRRETSPPRGDRREPIDTSERVVSVVVRDRDGERVIST